VDGGVPRELGPGRCRPGALESAGIETITPDEYAADLGWYAPSAIGMIRVLVREEDLAAARELTTGVHRLPEDGSPDPATAASAEPVLPRQLGLSTVIGRGFLDCFLTAILPCVIAFPAVGGLHTQGNSFLGALFVEPSLLAVATWRRRMMAHRGEPVPPLWGGAWEGNLMFGLFLGAALGGLAVIYKNLVVAPSVHRGYSDPLWHALDSSTGLVIVLGVLAAPICEEVFFRGSILGAFAASGRRGWGVFLSSALFSALHFDLRYAPLFFVDGLILSAVFLGMRSLLCPVIAHTVANAVVFAAALALGW
jgi:membrane protease YdiL (CAAX protease family)